MKKILLTSVAMGTILGSALAADLPTHKAPPAAPVPMWTGFYAGLNAGYNFGTNERLVSTNWGAGPLDTGSGSLPLLSVGSALSGSTNNYQNGFIGGAQLGYNYQYGNNIVIGLEADIQGTNTVGKSNVYGYGYSTGGGQLSSAAGHVSVNSGVSWLGTVRGRLGYLWTPTMLIYGTAGLTYAGVDAQANSYAVNMLPASANPASGGFTQIYNGNNNQSQILLGWNAGGGVEWMFMPNWSLKGEAIYWNTGNTNLSNLSVGVPGGFAGTGFGCGTNNWGCTSSLAGGNVRINYQGVIARAGVNYHFNFGNSPVVAKF